MGGSLRRLASYKTAVKVKWTSRSRKLLTLDDSSSSSEEEGPQPPPLSAL
jgi:hypothetical protein